MILIWNFKVFAQGIWEQDTIEKPTLGYDQKILRGLFIFYKVLPSGDSFKN